MQGRANFPGHPNVLRLTVGETQERSRIQLPAVRREPGEEEIAILEANLDDLNPQVIGYIIERRLPQARSTSSPRRCR